MKRFTVRIYGILIQTGSILVSDEHIKGTQITKFPGGGLEFGEGPLDCLKREFREEMNLEIEVISHFYTTDFYVVSAYDKNCQVMSIYYLIKPIGEINTLMSDQAHDYKHDNNTQAFRWIPLSQVSPSDFTFAIDKKVAEMLKLKA